MPIETSVTANRLVKEVIQCNRVWVSKILIDASQKDLSKTTVQIEATPYYDDGQNLPIFSETAINIRSVNVGKLMQKYPEVAQAFGAIMVAVQKMHNETEAKKAIMDATATTESAKKTLVEVARAALSDAQLVVTSVQNQLSEAQAANPKVQATIDEKRAAVAVASTAKNVAQTAFNTANAELAIAREVATTARLAWMDLANDA